MSDAGENAAEDTSYLVEVKRSARRRSAAAGEHVRHEGRYRTFGSKALAREWARESTSSAAAGPAVPLRATPAAHRSRSVTPKTSENRGTAPRSRR
ncbi:hypothetical protein BRC68_17010 [Halobacteriales archaeon QH_6_64_20]|nr:MAG: hypothetical protein BRC68_17010 [Halobacteriales archaeon QH_6_64_20]